MSARSPIQITIATWKALFLREAVSRLLTGRAAWLWIVLEPVTHIVFMLLIFVVARMKTIGGIDAGIWLIVGMLAFFMFRRTAMQAMNAVNANQALFTYRQVKPIDTVLVRAGLEGFLMLMVSVILLGGAGLMGWKALPADMLLVLESVGGLWLLGVGFGLIASVADELVSELGKLIGLAMMPLYLASGVIFPISTLPEPYRGWLMLNPIAHGLEAAREGFAPFYHPASELSMAYLYSWALCSIFFGLALHVRYAHHMVSK